MDHKETYKSLKIEGENFMDKLIIRALLGVQEAQRECTEKGIVLPCPCCGSEAKSYENSYLHYGYVVCTKCECKTESDSELNALANWNERPAPPIVRCGECEWYVPGFECEGWRPDCISKSCVQTKEFGNF